MIGILNRLSLVLFHLFCFCQLMKLIMVGPFSIDTFLFSNTFVQSFSINPSFSFLVVVTPFTLVEFTKIEWEFSFFYSTLLQGLSVFNSLFSLFLWNRRNQNFFGTCFCVNCGISVFISINSKMKFSLYFGITEIGSLFSAWESEIVEK